MKRYIDEEFEEAKKNSRRKVVFALLAIILAVGIPISYVVYTHFYSMNHLPEGKWIHSSSSPNQQYKLNIYRVKKGRATGSYSIRGELTNVSTGKQRNIYWGHKEYDAQVKWEDNHHVSINNKVLDARTDTYDWRRE
ncbi:DUF5412 family protein [Bacillus swezeyi]|uniref:DUF5412 domain-containing protein n=1 Tax=Bacillus swezeyi TaxID=1925020 RepID=A0A5M8RQ34_9BACI|nr:DUF5412 family protein [Bacillus swezeyi]KAA6450635.1 hypothetical protein DX927_07145 [Bacillus swezeyi]KAA6475189.1 hypothetical protein DX928_14470 [Bacillus swezeyi]TYS37171.1 hypothetical protein FZC77_06995 [Bacillus swezeyi]